MAQLSSARSYRTALKMVGYKWIQLKASSALARPHGMLFLKHEPRKGTPKTQGLNGCALDMVSMYLEKTMSLYIELISLNGQSSPN